MAKNEIVRGTVYNEKTNKFISDLNVVAYLSTDNNTPLGSSVTDAEGQYQIVVSVDKNDEVYIKIIIDDFEIINDTTDTFKPGKSDGDTIKDFYITMPNYVTGTLLTHDGKIDLAGADTITIVEARKVEVLKKDFGRETLLNEGVSDAKGFFKIYYRKESDERIDIFVKVFKKDEENVPEFTSNVIIDAQQHEVVDFLVTGDEYIGLPSSDDTFNKIETAVSIVTDFSKLTDEDVKILALDSDIDEDTAKKYIRASQIIKDTIDPLIHNIDLENNFPNITSEVLFGLMQKGISVEPSQMLIQDKNILYNTIIDATDSNIINSGEIFDEENPNNNISKEQWAENVTNELKLLSVSLVENKTSGETGKFTLFNVIQDIPEAKRDNFLNEYVLNTDSDDEFWVKILNLKDDQDVLIFGEEEIEKIKYNLDLSLFSDQHERTFAELHTFSSTNNITTLKKLAENNTDWSEIAGNLTEAQFPEYIEGNTLIEKQTNYTKYLEDKIAEKFTSEVIIANIKANTDTSLNEITTFFGNNIDFAFGINKININDWDTSDLSNIETTDTELKKAQRLFNILPSKDKTATFNLLWTSGIKSAHSIITLGEIEFAKLFVSSEISSEVVKELYLKAQNKNSKATEIFSKYNNRTNATDAHVLPDRPESDNPDLETLFNSFDYCDCKDCRSTLSPSAYLTDNLAFLRQIKTIDSTIFDKLIERRPDIEKTLLSCKNTDTPIPYIDIVNEVLESAVSGEPDITEHQTKWEPDEIDANPEHFNSAAYDTLKTSDSPLNLPYNYWNDEAKGFLSHFNLKLSDIIELFPGVENASLNEAIAFLGMSLENKDFIVSNTYSYSESNIVNILKDTQLEYDEFVDLLRSIYTNPNNDIVINHTEDCSITGAQLKYSNGDSIDFNTDNVLKRLFNFIRLLNITGWTLEELDKIIVWWNDSINDDFIKIISAIKKIQNLTNLPVEELLTWWNNIDTVTHINSENSFYNSKFLNRTLETGETSIFNLDIDGEIAVGISISDNISEIASVVNLKEEQIKELLDDGQGDLGELSIEILTKLNKYSAITKVFGISIAEYDLLYAMSFFSITKPPISTSTPVFKTLEFIGILEKVKNSGFNINDLAYLLYHADIDSDYKVKFENKNAFSVNLQSELNLLKEDYNSGKFDAETLLNDVLISLEINNADIKDTVKIINKTYNTATPNDIAFINNHLTDIFKGVDPVLNLTTGENQILNIEERFQYVLDGLEQDIFNFIFKEIIISNFVSEFNIDIDFTNKILQNYVSIDSVSAIDIFTDKTFLTDILDESSEYHTIYEIINKASVFINKYEISLSEYEASSKAQIFDIFNLPTQSAIVTNEIFNKWKNLDSAYILQNKYFKDTEYNIFNFISNTLSNEDKDILLGLTGWNNEDFISIAPPILETPPVTITTIEILDRINNLFEISKVLGVSFATLSVWTDLNEINTTSKTIKSAVKAKYDTEAWKTIATPIMKELREKRRDTLSTYLINYGYIRTGLDTIYYQDTNELYEYFLLDTEMSACAKTSRIVLANSVMQLFVQRVQMNLEGSELVLDDKQAKEWVWRKKYRVWEANRKVFLYPENWLEPELRDDKSPFFKEMEEELLQVDLDSDSAETIYKNYLEKLDEVAKLEIAQHYFDKETGDLHVFARTFSTPNIYYYRKRNYLKKWTAWEKLDLEISGKIIMPVVYNNTLYLFWIKYIPVKSEDENQIADIHIMWSEFKNNKWSPGKMSEEAFKNAHIDVVTENKRYYFIEKVDESIYINAALSRENVNYVLENNEKELKFNLFEKTFEKINTGVRTFINNVNKADLNKYFNGKYYFDKSKFLSLNYSGYPAEGVGNEYWNELTWDPSNIVNTIVPDVGYKLTFPHQEKFYKSENPFFFEDAKHTFLVVPNEPYTRYVQDADEQIKATASIKSVKKCHVHSLTSVIRASIPVYESAINFNRTSDTENEITRTVPAE